MRKNSSFLNIKKLRVIAIAIGLAVSITACGNKTNTTDKDKYSIEAELTDNQKETDNKKETEKDTSQKESTKEPEGTDKTTNDSTDDRNDVESETTKKTDSTSETTTKRNTTQQTTKPSSTTQPTTKPQQTQPPTTRPKQTTQPITQPTTQASQNNTQQVNTPEKTDNYSGINISGTPDTVATNVVNALIKSGMSQEQKVRALHDYLVKTIKYEISENQDIYTAKGALVNRVAVCEGYANAFKLLCNKASIQCEILYGDGVDSSGQLIPHAWNVVNVDGAWYQIDVTWDDPIVAGMSESECQSGANLTYAYYLIPDSIMYMDHILGDDSRNPSIVCTSTKYEKSPYYNYITTETDFSNLIYNLVQASGKRASYNVYIQCTNGLFDQFMVSDPTNYGNARIFTLLNNGIKNYANGYANSINYTIGGNQKYEFRKLTFSVVWQ